MVIKTTQLILKIAFILPLLLAASCGPAEGGRGGTRLNIAGGGAGDDLLPADGKDDDDKKISTALPVTLPPGGEQKKGLTDEPAKMKAGQFWDKFRETEASPQSAGAPSGSTTGHPSGSPAMEPASVGNERASPGHSLSMDATLAVVATTRFFETLARIVDEKCGLEASSSILPNQVGSFDPKHCTGYAIAADEPCVVDFSTDEMKNFKTHVAFDGVHEGFNGIWHVSGSKQICGIVTLPDDKKNLSKASELIIVDDAVRFDLVAIASSTDARNDVPNSIELDCKSGGESGQPACATSSVFKAGKPTIAWQPGAILASTFTPRQLVKKEGNRKGRCTFGPSSNGASRVDITTLAGRAGIVRGVGQEARLVSYDFATKVSADSKTAAPVSVTGFWFLGNGESAAASNNRIQGSLQLRRARDAVSDSPYETHRFAADSRVDSSDAVTSFKAQLSQSYNLEESCRDAELKHLGREVARKLLSGAVILSKEMAQQEFLDPYKFHGAGKVVGAAVGFAATIAAGAWFGLPGILAGHGIVGSAVGAAVVLPRHAQYEVKDDQLPVNGERPVSYELKAVTVALPGGSLTVSGKMDFSGRDRGEMREGRIPIFGWSIPGVKHFHAVKDYVAYANHPVLPQGPGATKLIWEKIQFAAGSAATAKNKSNPFALKIDETSNLKFFSGEMKVYVTPVMDKAGRGQEFSFLKLTDSAKVEDLTIDKLTPVYMLLQSGHRQIYVKVWTDKLEGHSTEPCTGGAPGTGCVKGKLHVDFVKLGADDVFSGASADDLPDGLEVDLSLNGIPLRRATAAAGVP